MTISAANDATLGHASSHGKMRALLGSLVGIHLVLIGHAFARADANQEQELQRGWEETVRTFLQDHCIGCHGNDKREGEFDLSPYSTVAHVTKDFATWSLVLQRLEAGEMPPEDAERQPSIGQRRKVVEWIGALRDFEAERNAGDPGRVLARRLSNAEYNYTIRDLTGVDMRPTREFPVDPANETGFDNSAESLAMTPALLTKYLGAGRVVAEHLVLKPDGFAFAPHPVVTDTDRDKYCVRRIIDFYQRQRTDYADYFYAAWRFQHRASLGKPTASLAEVAGEQGISAKYLAKVWGVLSEPQDSVGPMAKLQEMWRALPCPQRQ